MASTKRSYSDVGSCLEEPRRISSLRAKRSRKFVGRQFTRQIVAVEPIVIIAKNRNNNNSSVLSQLRCTVRHICCPNKISLPCCCTGK